MHIFRFYTNTIEQSIVIDRPVLPVSIGLVPNIHTDFILTCVALHAQNTSFQTLAKTHILAIIQCESEMIWENDKRTEF